ncbi:MAG: hypothetical protein QXO32_06355 [Candidatus Bathyarchaeia archaeon]
MKTVSQKGSVNIEGKALKAKDLVLIAVFSALWTVLQIQLGPIIGRFSIGPISLHGSVNRVVGWLLMTVLAHQTSGFGKISLMSTISAFGTRTIRVNPLEGLIVGSGYALGGLIFDLLANIKRKSVDEAPAYLYLLITVVSSLAASTPYLLSRTYFLGLKGFVIASSLYFFSTVKGVVFSLFGSSLGIQINARLKGLVRIERLEQVHG